MFRSMFLLIPVVFLFSCDNSGDTTLEMPKEADSTAPALAIPKDVPKDVPKDAGSTDAVSNVGGGIEKASSNALGNIADSTAKAVPDISSALGSSVSVGKFKELIGSLDSTKLKGLADKLVTALKSNEGGAELLQGLKSKLSLVVDKLKGSGIDVSKYTALLGS